jgi:homocysteine S-methyltransferase
VVYPNSGEHYDPVSKTWHHHGEACETLAGFTAMAGRRGEADWRLLRTTPKDIAELNAQR